MVPGFWRGWIEAKPRQGADDGRADGTRIAPRYRARSLLTLGRPEPQPESGLGAQADGGGGDTTLGVDHEARRHPSHAPAAGDTPIGIWHHRKIQVRCLKVGQNLARLPGLQGDGQHPMIPGNGIDKAVHGATDRTPARPKVHQDRLAP